MSEPSKKAELKKDRDDWKDLLDFYFNHHMNCGGERRWCVDSPLGKEWRLTQKVYEKWVQIDGPGDRKDFRHPDQAIRKARELAIRGGSWSALDAAMAKGEG